MARIELKGLCKGWDHVVLDRLDLTVEEGEFFVLLGPSGIGKTTLLRLIAGLEKPDAGSVFLGDKDITKLPPYRRRVAMTFESYALYPHLSVFENIASPLRARGVSRSEIEKRVKEVAQLLRIDDLLGRRPGEVSGGQKQRTALGRTLVADPEVFLLDEPISHLDAKIRHQLREQFRTLEALRRVATLYVTHDYAEALSLGDRIGVLGHGGLVQVGSARDLFERPTHVFVAQQLGQPGINVIDGRLFEEAGRLQMRAQDGALSLAFDEAQGHRLNGRRDGALTLGIRPQHIRVLDGEEAELAHEQVLDARITLFEPLGATGIAITEASGVRLTALSSPERHFDYGEMVRLAVDGRAYHFFDPVSGVTL
ncbi:MAG: ABC transporter ATP-binding protein [Alphaproteobacteria bacterium]